MKRLFRIAFIGAILLAVGLGTNGGGSDVRAQDQGAAQRFLVFTTGERGVNQGVRNAVVRAGGQTLDEVRVQAGLEFLAVRLPGSAVADLARERGVIEVALDVAPSIPGHDPNTSQALDWGVNRIEADLVWPSGVTGLGVVVAVVDTGTQLDHADIYPNTLGPIHADCSGDGDCRSSAGATTPGSAGYDNNGDGHGTGVTGIVAAVDNAKGTVGVSHQARILAVNCFEPATFFSCLRGVRYAGGLDQNGGVVSEPRARVVNMSWGWEKKLEKQCPSCVTTINAIMEEVWGRNLVLAAAAGNSGVCGGRNDTVIYPARLDKPLAVAATTSGDTSPCWSSTGKSLDLAAPGVSVESPWYGGYTTWSGTSASTPHVSGVAALVLSKNTTLTNATVKALLKRTAQDLKGGTSTGEVCGGGQVHDTWFGCGLVRADLAVQNTPSP